MADMLVNLYELPSEGTLLTDLSKQGIEIIRALSLDKHIITNFIKKYFDGGDSWASECEAAFTHTPISCFIAVCKKKIIGFGCYESTAKDYFGPTGVSKQYRKKGIGKALLLKCLYAMKEEGYGYAIIGWPADDAIHFYENSVGATLIKSKNNGVYERMINSD